MPGVGHAGHGPQRESQHEYVGPALANRTVEGRETRKYLQEEAGWWTRVGKGPTSAPKLRKKLLVATRIELFCLR